MDFKVRPLRVQIPCKSITVIDPEEHDAQLQAHRYWRALATGHTGIEKGGWCEECSANPSEPLCKNESQELDISVIIDVTVLPILRKQFEARLREITEAEEAAAKAMGGG